MGLSEGPFELSKREQLRWVLFLKSFLLEFSFPVSIVNLSGIKVDAAASSLL
jgi:hypothetical protein